MRPLPNSLAARDIAYQMHPYTNIRRHEEVGPMVIERGKGIHVFDDGGKEYIEAMAGLWSVALGFGEERLVKAATDQFHKLPYYHSFTHKANEPSIELATKLVEITPEGLDHVFFTNSGSEANDTVVKMVWFYNNALNRPQKKKFIARNGGYHGINVASGSLTGLQVNQKGFDLPLDFVRHVTCPHHYRFAQPGESEEAFSTRLAEELDAVIMEEGPETVAALIGEPVLGAGGVIVPPRTYWEKVQAVCRKHDVLVVADEVINGFGRTGTLFACEKFGIEPDMLVLSKQLTSSYMPLAAVLMSDRIYQAMADQTARLGNFGHGYTASGHPVAAAVGLENLRIYEEEGLVERAIVSGARMQEHVASFARSPIVGEVRGVGLIAAIELVADKATKAPFDPPGKVGMYLAERGHAHGIIIRAIRDTIALCPPMIIRENEVDEMIERLSAAFADTERFVANGMTTPAGR